MRDLTEVGFRTKGIAVKNVVGNEAASGKRSSLCRCRAIRGGFYIFRHE